MRAISRLAGVRSFKDARLRIRPIASLQHSVATSPMIARPWTYRSQQYATGIFSASEESARHSDDLPPRGCGSPSTILVNIDDEVVSFSSLLLRDLCECPQCVHESSRQKLYSTADIPTRIRAREVDQPQSGRQTIRVRWENDAPGFGPGHETHLGLDTLRQLSNKGACPGPFQAPADRQVLWAADNAATVDVGFDRYLMNDEALFHVMRQLRTHGLAFITEIPQGKEDALIDIATRMGPMKDTFYGLTWDVRTVPSAINAAYTSHDLGFHTDLLYFQSPPHVQLLHCLQSSSSGGASVFTDAFTSAADLLEQDEEAFNALATIPVNYHYKHPDSNLYHTTKTVFELRPLQIGNQRFSTFRQYLDAVTAGNPTAEQLRLTLSECLEKVNWGPPFLAPFSLQEQSAQAPVPSDDPVRALNDKMTQWHSAAKKFSALLHRPEALHERLMKPGECVLFDNTRVLHARRAFNAGDVGRARWLKGGYVDKDPYLSKLRVLQNKYAGQSAHSVA